MTILISGEIRIDPDDFDAALALVEPLVAATHAEGGCVQYDFWVDPRDRGRIRVFEEWASQEANDVHARSEHLAAFLTGIAKLRVAGAELVRYEVAAQGPL
jgi:quinol monooxygenase YgiN